MKLNYKHDELSFKKLKDNIVLPKFQRKLVWSAEKKKSFISTLLKGDPCGIFLLYKNEDDTYTLIDGLQRYSTMVDFVENPASYVDIERDYGNQINDIIGCLKEVKFQESVVRKCLISSIQKYYVIGNRPTEMKNKVVSDKNNSYLLTSDDAREKITDLFEQLNEDFDISHLQIQAIIYTGDFDNLPEIFENMNSNGTQLSKYDVFAAAWYKLKFPVENDEILNAVEDKYKDMVANTDLHIDSYEEGNILSEKEINLYELCVAIGRILQNSYKTLFPVSDNNSSKYESIGFNLLSTIFTKSPKNKDKLRQYFEDVHSKDVENLVQYIKSSVSLLEKYLHNYIVAFNGENVFKYIESQMICMISTVFYANYEYLGEGILFKPRNLDKKCLELIRKNLPKRYLYDIVTNHWGNTGDKKVAKEMDVDIYSNRFLTPITISYWRTGLDEWMKSQETDKKNSIQIESKLFINYLYVLQNNVVDYQCKIDCVIPKERIYTSLKGATGKYSTSNVAFIPTVINNEKKYNDGKTIYELSFDKKNDNYTLECLLYPSMDEILFAINGNEFSNEQWMSYLKNRRNSLIDKFCKEIQNI